MSSDLRHCVRIATPDARLGQLVTARLTLPALILNESARGFGVFVEGADHFEPGQAAALEIDGGLSPVRIVRISETDDGQELGLERLPDGDQPFQSARHARSFLLRPLLYSPQAIAVVAVMFVIGVLAGTLSFEFSGSRAEPVRFQTGKPRSRPATKSGREGMQFDAPGSPARERNSAPGNSSTDAKTARVKIPLTAGRALNRLSRQATDNLPSPEAIAKLTALAPERLNQWRAQLDSLPWEPQELLGLLTVELAKLNLSAQQQELIAAIVRRVVAELSALAAQSGLVDQQTAAAQRLQSAAIEAINQVFTPDQREQWRALAEPAPPAG